MFFADATLVLPDRLLAASTLAVEGDRIVAINEQPVPTPSRALSLPGRLILPGLIDVHSDAIEKAVEPRPRVFFPLEHAVAENDRLHLSAGITTVFNALSIAGAEFGMRDPAKVEALIDVLASAPAEVRRKLHLRYEISDTDSRPLVEKLLRDGRVDLLSLMDHSPGQGQYATPGAYKRYLMRTYTMTEAQTQTLIRKKEKTRLGADPAFPALLALARSCGVPTAAHDLDTPAHVAEWKAWGAEISEFPLCLETALDSRAAGLPTVMGAPNVVRGQSSGNGLRAADGIRAGAVDILCSDYAPGALLPALFRLAAEGACSLPEAVAMASLHPAEATRLDHLGALRPGYLADLLVVRPTPEGPFLEAVYREGQLVLARGAEAARFMAQ